MFVDLGGLGGGCVREEEFESVEFVSCVFGAVNGNIWRSTYCSKQHINRSMILRRSDGVWPSQWAKPTVACSFIVAAEA